MNGINNANQPIESVNNNVALSLEQKSRIEAVATEYFEKIMKIDVLEMSDNLLTDLLKIVNMLEKYSANPDFLSAYFLEVGKLIQRATDSDSYTRKVELYLNSPIIKLFIGEDSNSLKKIILSYFKHALADKAIHVLNTEPFGGLVKTFRLMQLTCLSSEPIKQFALKNYKEEVPSLTNFIIDAHELYTAKKDFLTLLAKFDKYFNSSK